jgi:hypothetical protein
MKIESKVSARNHEGNVSDRDATASSILSASCSVKWGVIVTATYQAQLLSKPDVRVKIVCQFIMRPLRLFVSWSCAYESL